MWPGALIFSLVTGNQTTNQCPHEQQINTNCHYWDLPGGGAINLYSYLYGAFQNKMFSSPVLSKQSLIRKCFRNFPTWGHCFTFIALSLSLSLPSQTLRTLFIFIPLFLVWTFPVSYKCSRFNFSLRFNLRSQTFTFTNPVISLSWPVTSSHVNSKSGHHSFPFLFSHCSPPYTPPPWHQSQLFSSMNWL